MTAFEFFTPIIGSCFILIPELKDNVLAVAAAFVFWNANIVSLLFSNFVARSSTSSGVSVSKASVSCKVMFFIFKINRSQTISSSRNPNSDRAACAVSAA